MFKKVYIVATLATLCGTISAETAPTSLEMNSSISSAAALDSIKQARNEIMLELQETLSFYEQAENHFKSIFGETVQSPEWYLAAKQKCIEVLNRIVESPEFVATINEVTDAQVALIIDKNAISKDMIIGPSAALLEQKVKNEIANAAFDKRFDKQIKQFFNVMYVTVATIRGSKVLLEKLAAIELEQQLIAEGAALPASDH